jgi:hypothetical protein
VVIGKEVMNMNGFGEPIPMINSVDFPTFYVPVLIMPSIRVEPEFGLLKYSTSLSGVDEKYTVMFFGAGIFLTQWYGQVELHLGGRVNWLLGRYHHENGWEYTVTRIDFTWGPAIGGEYFFTKNLSLGGEVQFNFVKIGNSKTDPEVNAADNVEEAEQSPMRTKPLVFVRWYFGAKD